VRLAWQGAARTVPFERRPAKTSALLCSLKYA